MVNPHVAATGPSGTPTFTRHGPFYRVQRRLGLLSDHDLAVGKRAVIFVCVAWIPALLLAALQGYAIGDHHERARLLDFSVYAFCIAIAAFVLMEGSADARMAWLVGEFNARGIVPESARPGVRSAIENMGRRTGFAFVEILLLIAAYAISYQWITHGALRAEDGTWYAHVVNGRFQLTLAGWWTLLVGMPLFWFVLGRWLWRFYTWGRLLRDIAQCGLRLVATHPDRCGGLAFIGKYPTTYVLFVFALSTVVAATVLKAVVFMGASIMSFKYALAGLVLFLIAAFVLPLLVFTPVLLRLKKQGLSQYGALVSRHNIAFEEKWVHGVANDSVDEEPLGSPDMSSLADLSASYELIQNIRLVPITKESIMPLVVAALLPLAATAATQVPVKQILGALKGLLIL